MMQFLALLLIANAVTAWFWTHDNPIRGLFFGVFAFCVLSEACAAALFFGAVYALANMR
jgi:hypothetical protein